MKHIKNRAATNSGGEAKLKDCPYESQEHRTKMYQLLCGFCMGGAIHASCCNYPKLRHLVRSLREIGVRIDEHYQESIHDRHHAWEPGKETKLFHHCSYSADAQAIKVFLPLIEHHGETLIDQILSSKGAKQ